MFHYPELSETARHGQAEKKGDDSSHLDVDEDIVVGFFSKEQHAMVHNITKSMKFDLFVGLIIAGNGVTIGTRVELRSDGLRSVADSGHVPAFQESIDSI